MPTVSVRLLDGSPETAAKLVRYANVDQGYGIEYWSIGNEPTLFEKQLRETYDTERFNREWRAIAEAMKAADPSIRLMGPELHQWGVDLASTPKDSVGPRLDDRVSEGQRRPGGRGHGSPLPHCRAPMARPRPSTSCGPTPQQWDKPRLLSA